LKSLGKVRGKYGTMKDQEREQDKFVVLGKYRMVLNTRIYKLGDEDIGRKVSEKDQEREQYKLVVSGKYMMVLNTRMYTLGDEDIPGQ
jgi:hypothetical protein